VTDIVEFLTARLNEDKTAIKAMGAEGAGRWWVGQRFDGSLDPEGSTVFVDVRRSDGLGYIHLGAPGMLTGPTAMHIARHDPARVLAEVAAKRAILTLHSPENLEYVNTDGDDRTGTICATCDSLVGNWPCDTLKLLAAVYADHPDYKSAWRVE
jgi:hypothetical protein